MLRGSLVFAALLAASVAAAQDYKAGDKVVVVKMAKLSVEKGDGPSVYPGSSLVVEEVKGDRILVTRQETSGWLEKSNVVPFDKGIDYFTAALKADPAKAENRLARAVLRETVGDHDGTIADCDELIRTGPNATVYNLRGAAWQMKREPDKAISDFTDAIGLDTNSPTAYANRGLAWAQKHEYDKALSDYDEALRLNPNYARCYYYRGLTWGIKHEYDKAIADLDEAIRLEPKLSGAYDFRGRAWTKKGDYVKAVADFDVAILIDPKNAAAYSGRGIAWEKSGEHEKAIADGNEAIRVAPKSAAAYDGRGNIWNDQRAYANAAADFETAIRLEPKYPTPYNSLAWLRATCPEEKFRNGKAAVENATKLCELAKWSDDGAHFDTLAAAYAEAGQFDKAVKWQTKAVVLAIADVKADYQSRLDLYKAGKPYREPPPKK